MTELFKAPPISTKAERGEVVLEPVFEVTLELDQRRLQTTVRGERIHQRILGGMVSGPKLTGKVYANGAGEFGLIRQSDAVEETFSRFMIVADNGEWLYTQLAGYVRADGYARFQAVFDADVQGPHGWLNENMFIAKLNEETPNRRTFTYFLAR